jgi:PadR family transcriptional regulator AphA
MATGAVSLRYFVLGLLTQQPMSGYDIKHFLSGLSWLAGSPSSGSLYPALRALHRERLVTVETVAGIDRPPKKIYSITEPGREALRAWIEEPITVCASLKAFVMRLFLADSHTRPMLSAHLEQRRAQVATHHESLTDTLKGPDAESNLGQQLALDYGLALATAELAWLDTTLDRLENLPRP